MRIVVVGTSGAGKTTLAKAIASEFDLPHIELDALYWGAGWRAADPVEFAARVGATISSGAWVVDGNYGAVRASVLGTGDTLNLAGFQPDRDHVPRHQTIDDARYRSNRAVGGGNREGWRHWL